MLVWLTQKLMAELFDVSIPTINEHLKNIFETKELNEDSVVRNFRITAADGKEYDTMHYNLNMKEYKEIKIFLTMFGIAIVLVLFGIAVNFINS